MQKKKMSLREFKDQKKKAWKRKSQEEVNQKHRDAIRKIKLMTDSELQRFAGEPINDRIHADARQILGVRMRKQTAKKAKARPKKAEQAKKAEQGGSPPVIGDVAQPDWWRDS